MTSMGNNAHYVHQIPTFVPRELAKPPFCPPLASEIDTEEHGASWVWQGYYVTPLATKLPGNKFCSPF